ncbi:hypothetical protein MPH_05802 [Macrophomina phaseolina MS6]|uniref:Uncharacterized protein n=1 Tax=Macrophomina phaseolina (strain MS6) TaxID=1126212 RepID=K2R3R8_MACPH|nr:hypothetical protein MPH_05802 [Macrophomina phaseolina MS6]
MPLTSAHKRRLLPMPAWHCYNFSNNSHYLGPLYQYFPQYYHRPRKWQHCHWPWHNASIRIPLDPCGRRPQLPQVPAILSALLSRSRRHRYLHFGRPVQHRKRAARTARLGARRGGEAAVRARQRRDNAQRTVTRSDLCRVEGNVRHIRVPGRCGDVDGAECDAAEFERVVCVRGSGAVCEPGKLPV